MPSSQQLTVKQAISRAKKAVKEGKIEIALELYNAVLQYQPTHPIAKKGMRKLQQRLPDNQSTQAEEENPPQEQIDSLFNLHYSGERIKVEQTCRVLLQTYPKSLIVYDLLGAALLGQGKLKEAVLIYDQVIQQYPSYAEAYTNRGVALKQLGLLGDATVSHAKAIELNSNFAEAHNNLGSTQRELGQLDAALESCKIALQLNPNFPEGYNNLGNILKDLGRLSEAVENYEKAIDLKDNLVSAYDNLVSAYDNLGNALKELGDLDGAIRNYKRALVINPNFAEAYNNLGNALKDVGLLDDAVRCLEKAVNLKDNLSVAYRNLSMVKKYKLGDPQIEVIKHLYAKAKPNSSDRKHVSFALTKVYEDLKDYDASFGYLCEGNGLRKKELKYSILSDRRLFSLIQDAFNLIDKSVINDNVERAEIQPIFIVGMPRSGTSLVEQVVATHSQVFGAGELKAMGELVPSVFLVSSEQGLDIKKIVIDDLVLLHNNYVEVLTSLGISEDIVTDKMPLNFRWIGFILTAFPGAKIICLNRDPMAVCWSIYKHYFSSDGNGYAHNLSDLVEFYGLYTNLMIFWHENFPGKIYDLNYELLTENQEEETRRLLEYCGLPWEDNCLDFHKNKRAVKTASATQVRQKMYTGSSEAWRKYEKHLHPLLDGLRKYGFIDENGNSTIGINSKAANGINFVAK
jgi:tetratricopeptide (TPR) repeat protein